MKNIVILGCENSHANTFLNFVRDDAKYSDVNVVGVYSDDAEAANKLNEKYGVPVMNSYSDALGKVDGVVITARHGDNHFKYAVPYISSGVPMFIDKPITVDEDEAIKFMRLCRSSGVRVTGGSSCIHDEFVQSLKKAHLEKDGGETLGGSVRAPISMENAYGGFFFYAQHLVEILIEIFGRYPVSVITTKNGKNITAIVKYENYDVTALFTDGVYVYSASRAATEKTVASDFKIDGRSPCFKIEFDEVYSLLSGGEQKMSYDDFIAPVFVMNAVYRSLSSGKEEKINKFKV